MEKRLLADGLYQYLLRLQGILQERGAFTLAEKVQFASRFAFGSTTELYTEAENALRGVLAEHGSILREQELCELREILKGIDAEFKLIGGS